MTQSQNRVCVANTFIYTDRFLPTSLGHRWEARVRVPSYPHCDLLILVVSRDFPQDIFDLASVHTESSGPDQDEPQQLPVLPAQ